MASNFIPLQEAAERLGIPTDRLVEMRSQGEIRGFRDGASWKFPETEIDRVKEELADVLDDAPAGGSSLLVSEETLGGSSGSSKSKVIGGDDAADANDGSDLTLEEEPSGAKGSDVNLVASQGDDQDVDLVPASEKPATSGAGSDVDDELTLASDPMEGSDANLDSLDDELNLAKDPAEASANASDSDKESVLSDIDLSEGESGGTGDLIHGDSDPAINAGVGSGGLDDALSDDDDLVIAADDDDDLVLGGAGSDISVAGDSGINLRSPSDSGLSLESEPLDLAGSSISALDLGAEIDESGSKGSGSGIGSGSGSLVDFQADEEFQLSPSGGDVDGDDDSGSQVIEVEDSQAFGSDVGIDEGDDVFGDADVVAGEGLEADDALAADDVMEGDEFGVDADTAVAAGPAARPVYEVPFSVFNVITLACVLFIMCLGGMLMTDLMRNMWTYSETSAPVSSLTDALTDMAGLDP